MTLIEIFARFFRRSSKSESSQYTDSDFIRDVTTRGVPVEIFNVSENGERTKIWPKPQTEPQTERGPKRIREWGSKKEWIIYPDGRREVVDV